MFSQACVKNSVHREGEVYPLFDRISAINCMEMEIIRPRWGHACLVPPLGSINAQGVLSNRAFK